MDKTNFVKNKQASHLVKCHVYAHLYALKQTWYACKNNKKTRNKEIVYTRYFIEKETKNNSYKLSYNICDKIRHLVF